jgi:hypothetical protein
MCKVATKSVFKQGFMSEQKGTRAVIALYASAFYLAQRSKMKTFAPINRMVMATLHIVRRCLDTDREIGNTHQWSFPRCTMLSYVGSLYDRKMRGTGQVR